MGTKYRLRFEIEVDVIADSVEDARVTAVDYITDPSEWGDVVDALAMCIIHENQVSVVVDGEDYFPVNGDHVYA